MNVIETNVQKLTKDLKLAAALLTDTEARYLVDYYYITQEDRKRAGNQTRALTEAAEPCAVVNWLTDQAGSLEKEIKKALDAYTDAHPIGAWLKGITGIGPVLAAGLLAHIDIEKAPTVGHIWSFAGLNPTVKWMSQEKATDWLKARITDPDQVLVKSWVEGESKEIQKLEALLVETAQHFGRGYENLRRTATVNDEGQPVTLTVKSIARALACRPFNAALKTLCWKIGQSFLKTSGKEDGVYGKLYKQRKAYEIANNDAGKYADQAAIGAARVGKATEAYGHYSAGKLPPAQIDARARRYAVKQFLSDLHAVWYRHHFKKDPPLPYPIAILGHAHLRKVA